MTGGKRLFQTACPAADIRPLFGRVEPLPEESLLSLVARTAEANAHDRTANVVNEAGLTTAKAAYIPFSRVDDAEALATLLTVEPDEVRRRMHRRLGKSPHYVDWYGTPLERRFIQPDVRRLSPSALRQSAHHRAVWMIAPLSFCPGTFEKLLEACPRCGKKLRWSRTKGIARCEHCEAPLVEGEVDVLPVELQPHAATSAALIHPSLDVRQTAVSRLPAPFADWEAGHVFGALADISAITSHLDRRDCATHLISAFRVVMRWPDSLAHLVERATAQRRGRRHNFRLLIGPFGRFFDHSAPSTPFGTLIRAEVPRLCGSSTCPCAACHSRASSAWRGVPR